MFAAERGLACPSFGFDQNAKPSWEPLLFELENVLGRVPDIYAFITYDACWLVTLTYLQMDTDAHIQLFKDEFVFQAGHYYGVSGWTELNEAGDRAWATYDFWGVAGDSSTPFWHVVARYNNANNSLERY
jgi:branched-chain amino acid transport system substrate-binding protein